MRLAKAGSFSINKDSQFATGGSGQYNNEFTLDGVANTQASSTSARVGFIPPQTAVAECKVQTWYEATVGHTIGSLVNVSIKSGTNEPDGELRMAVCFLAKRATLVHILDDFVDQYPHGLLPEITRSLPPAFGENKPFRILVS
jgi:hypothetical protein